jgi:molybdopterin synthase sulfur carrier subunit
MEPIRVQVALPAHLRRLSGVSGSTVTVELPPAAPGTVTLGRVLDALEQSYPPLRGTIRDYPAAGLSEAGRLRPFMRFFALEEDLTPAGQSAPIPPEVLSGKEVLRIIGAIAGG